MRVPMRCPSLSELPTPPAGKRGWPWTEESARVTERVDLPRITVVTPSFNQGQFIEETIRSVLLQGYPDLEYFVLDGGSTDDSVDVIKKYSPWITFWLSEADDGQSAAINRGLRMGSGSYATWINSDDMLCRDALGNVPFTDVQGHDVVYLGDCVNIDGQGTTRFVHRGRVHTLEDLVRIPQIWRCGGYICQPEVLFPLRLALSIGGLDESNHLTMDYDFWGRLFLAGATFHYSGVPFGIFRHHEAQKTLQYAVRQTESMLRDAERLIARAREIPVAVKHDILADLQGYERAYPKEHWKQSGRLARIGLPPVVVKRIRRLRRAMAQTIGSFVSGT